MSILIFIFQILKLISKIFFAPRLKIKIKNLFQNFCVIY